MRQDVSNSTALRYQQPMDKVALISGRSTPALAAAISASLNLPLVKCNIIDFANGEINIEILENIRDKIVYFIQTGASSADGKRSINDHYVEAIQMADACRLSGVRHVGIIYATYPYARSDKKDKPRASIMSAVIARGLKGAGFHRIICMDVHAGQTQGVSKIPFDNLYAINLHVKNLQATVFAGMTTEEINEKFILIAPDAGGVRRIRGYAKKLGMRHVIMTKQRDYSQAGVVEKSELIGGNVSGKVAILVDDMGDTMGTAIAAINDLKGHGITSVIVVFTHGVFSGAAMERINNCEMISQVIVTDTIDQSVNMAKCPKLKVVTTAPLFGEVIKRLTCGGSLSELFE